jgi:hypothetical protein
MPWIIGGALVGSALIGGITSKMGADAGASAANRAADLAQQRYETTRGDLLPYNTAGQGALSDLSSLAASGPNGPGGTNYLSMASGMLPGQMTEAELQNTPGYQFQLGQGLKAVQNAAAGRGLGVSGTAMKGAATYATGLADSNYQQQFANSQTRFGDVLNLNTTQQGNLTNQFNRLNAVASLGENAGAQTGNTGATLANTAANATLQAGAYNAAGITGVGSAVNSAVGNGLSYNLLSQAIQRGNAGTNVGTGGYTGPTNAVVPSADPRGLFAPDSPGY